MTTKKIAEKFENEVEQARAEMTRREAEDPGRKAKAQAENTEVSWQEYFEWKGYFRGRKEDLQKLENKMNALKKLMEEETRKEAEAPRVVDEQDEDEKDHKDLEILKILMGKMGWNTYNMGSGRRNEKGGKVVLEERHFRRMEKYDGGGRQMGKVVV